MPKRVIKGTPEFHRWAFPEFIRHELSVGGPDPHMKIVKWICDHSDWSPLEKAWFVGCYVGPYNVPAAEVIFYRFDDPTDLYDIEEWLKLWWSKLPVRRERRPVRAPHKMAKHLRSYCAWLNNGALESLENARSFEESFSIVSQVYGNGRYATMKLYQALSMVVGVPKFPFVDIVPKGAWSPRLTLSWLYPEEAEALNGSDAARNLEIANVKARTTKEWLRYEQGIYLDWFNLEVMLCDYKQAYDGKQYPGRAHDSELEHGIKVSEGFSTPSLKLWQAREELFPYETLGELSGWTSRRKELGEVMTKHKYVWSDLAYDYNKTTDLAFPVARIR